jgi:GxxExxY protein
MTDLLFQKESYQIIGICMEVHRTLGMGLKEINYKDAMEIDFLAQSIMYDREKKFSVQYKEKILRNPYIPDFVVFDSIIVEVKAASFIIDEHVAQTLSYLAVTGLKLGLLVNFGERSLKWKRVVR